MDTNKATELNTSLAAGRMLSTGANKLSASLDSFSGWLLAGFGATYGLLFANLDSLVAVVSISNIKCGAISFVVSAGLAAIQKFIAVYVAAGTASAEEGRAAGKELAASPLDLDIPSMYRQVSEGLLWPWRGSNARMLEKVASGDYAVTGRFHSKASQVQCYLVVAQAILSLVSATYLISGIAI